MDEENTVKKSKKTDTKTSLVDAAKSGNKKKTLTALRDKLAETIQNCDSGRDMAANSKRLLEVMDELEAIKIAEREKREKKAAAKRPSKMDQLRMRNAR